MAVGIAFLLVLVTGLTYAPMLGGYFRHDDFSWLQVARQWSQSPEGLLALRHGHTGCTPVFNLLFWLLYRATGLHPLPYYAALIFSHALATLLVFRFAYTLSQSRLAAAVAGFFFGLHFVHHEAVTWIAVLYRPLCLSLLLGSLELFVRYRRQGSPTFLLASAALFLLAALTKEDALPALLLLPLLDAYLLPEAPLSWRARAPAYVPFGVALALYAALWPWTWIPGAVPPGEGLYWLGPHLLTNLVRCVPQMLVPDLDFVTYRELLHRFLLPGGVEAAVLISRILGVLVTLGAGALFVRGNRMIRFWVLWCYVMFLPFAPFAYEYALAPRYLYLPSVGLAMLVGLGMQAWDKEAGSRRQEAEGRQQKADHEGAKGREGTRKSGNTHTPTHPHTHTPTHPHTHTPTHPHTHWAAFVLVLLANAALLGLVQKHRLRDSAERRAILATVQTTVPNPEPGATIYLVGVPFHLRDVALAVPLFYDVPVEVRRQTAKTRRDAKGHETRRREGTRSEIRNPKSEIRNPKPEIRKRGAKRKEYVVRFRDGP